MKRTLKVVVWRLAAPVFLLTLPVSAQQADPPPRIWTTYHASENVESDLRDLALHGVNMADARASTIAEAKNMLAAARKTGMRLSIHVGGDPDAAMIRKYALTPTPGIFVGGAYRGKAIDRTLFSFRAEPQEILVEPPVYNQQYAYISKADSTPVTHYWPPTTTPLRAEVVVPLRFFDGRAHLQIIPATITPVTGMGRLDEDSVAPDLPLNDEIRNRTLYRLRFDLTGLGDALLDYVGVAVYWTFPGYEGTWYIFNAAPVSVFDPVTLEAARRAVQDDVALWTEANGGTFPNDVVVTARSGDEHFYLTGHLRLDTPSVNYPLWDYSEPSLAAFREKSGHPDFPRTWGYPEIYGAETYAWWLRHLHEGSADYIAAVKDELQKQAPGVALYRNTTRAGIFSLANDHDGSGPELLTRSLDVAHLDPYPVMATGFDSTLLPRDVSYYAGLARRYGKPLVPWVQAVTDVGTLKNQGGMRHPTPDQLDRMMEQVVAQGIYGVKWFGYGPGRFTFPKGNPATWDRAGVWAERLKTNPPAAVRPELAVLRWYDAWALTNYTADSHVRNPADWQLQQFLEVWAVRHGQPYDVFELPPGMDAAAREALRKDLTKYRYVVSTRPWPEAWVIGEGTETMTIDPATEPLQQSRYEAALKQKGWLP